MLRQIILWRLNSAERDLGVSVDYLRDLVRVSVRAFLAFAKIMPMAQYRRVMPADALNVARLCGSRSADCGSCVQIAINTALKEGLPSEVIRTVLERQPDDLPSGLAEVYRFSEAVLAHDDDAATPFRESVVARYGQEGIAEVGLALASSLVFPTMKRTLGYSKSCARVELALGGTTSES